MDGGVCRSAWSPQLVVCGVLSVTSVPVFCLISETKVIILTLTINTFPTSLWHPVKLLFSARELLQMFLTLICQVDGGSCEVAGYYILQRGSEERDK